MAARKRYGKCTQSASSYKNGCRCDVCRRCHADYGREWRRKTRRPDSTWTPRQKIDPTEAREHLLWLHDKGVPLIDIWRACGVDMTTLVAIREGRKSFILKPTAERVLAVGLNRVPVYEQVREHVETLLRRGWTQQDIARVTGLSDYTIYELHSAKRKRVWKRTAERLFALNATQPPPGR